MDGDPRSHRVHPYIWTEILARTAPNVHMDGDRPILRDFMRIGGARLENLRPYAPPGQPRAGSPSICTAEAHPRRRISVVMDGEPTAQDDRHARPSPRAHPLTRSPD